LTSNGVGFQNDGLIAAQKRAINAASTESVLVRKSGSPVLAMLKS